MRILDVALLLASLAACAHARSLTQVGVTRPHGLWGG